MERNAEVAERVGDRPSEPNGQLHLACHAAQRQISGQRINEIVLGKRQITADTALRMSRFFGTSKRFWMNLQARFDLEKERDLIAKELSEIQPLIAS